MPGPKPQPTALKILRGNPGKRRLPENEPAPPPASSDPPEYLTNPDAVAIWNAEAPALIALGLLGITHVRAFAMLCDLLATRREDLSNVQLAGILRLMDSFGMNPASQTKIHAPAKPKAESKWAGLIKA